jgi:hypothetical protein
MCTDLILSIVLLELVALLGIGPVIRSRVSLTTLVKEKSFKLKFGAFLLA